MLRLRVRDVGFGRIDTEDVTRGSGCDNRGGQRSRARSDVGDGVAVENACELHQKRCQLAAPSAHVSFVRVAEREHRGGRLLSWRYSSRMAEGARSSVLILNARPNIVFILVF